MATLILTKEFNEILNKQESIDALATKGYNSIDSFIEEIIKRLNMFDLSLNLRDISYHILQDTDTYIGIILDEYLDKLYNVCIIPPRLGTRSGFLSQQIFGFISNLINGRKTKDAYSLCDKPTIVINCMVDNLANSAICNVLGAKIMGFHYIDIFNRVEDFGSSNLSLRGFVDTVSLYKDISKDIEISQGTLVIKTQRLKDFTTSLTNEPYYFAMTAYPAVILAKKEGYKIDLSKFEEALHRGKTNKNIIAFISFVKGLNVSEGNMSSSAIVPLQQIFYGAPGTGKSYQIDDMTKNESVIRTTFHPDSDYSTFVGCYKPTTSKNKPDHLSYEELVEKLKDYKSRMDQSRACSMLGFQYPDSVKEIDEQGKILDLLKAVGITTGNYDTSIRCGLECYQTAKTNTSAITYEYVPQAFIQAYIKAWKFYQENPENPKKQYLIIEEINRGNCAQIFGDLFQLLDRNDQDLSSYSIVPDKDLQKHIADYGLKVTGILNNAETEDISDKINSGEILCLPSNLYIWATMNTSDQSLFPIDSAFKRRWEWKYMKIANMEKGYKIEVNGKHYDWWKFIDKMNTIIGAATSSEDKKLGYFFCKVKEGTTDITAEQFVSKVLFYIYGDALKDYDIKDDSFKKGEKDGKKIYYTFSDFYDAKGNVDKEMVAKLLDTFVGADEKATNEENQAKDENTAE